MRDLNQILEDIHKLSAAEKVSIYYHLSSTLTKKEKAIALLEKIKGKGKGLWGEDAQDYVNRLRADGRF